MAIGAAAMVVGFVGIAFGLWPDLADRFGPRVVSRIDADGGVPELVVRQDRRGHYIVPGTVNGVDVEFLLDTGATGVALPHALALRLGLVSGPPVEIVTASDVVPGYLVTLDEVSVGPLSLHRVRGSVSEHTIGDQVLLGMSFLRHFELSQRGGILRVRVPPGR